MRWFTLVAGSALLILFGQPSHAAPPPRPLVVLETNHGSITIELFADEAPLTVANFLHYVDSGFYNNTIFHRVIPGFVIQGGGFGPGLARRTPGRPVRNEAANGLTNRRGTLSMARTSDIHSATSQFFINLSDNPSLDHHGDAPHQYGYAVFGRVIKGMEVVDEIAAQPTRTVGYFQDVPADDVVLLRAFRKP